MPAPFGPAASPPGESLAAAVAAYHRSPARLGFHDILRRFTAACREVARGHASGRLHLAVTPRAVRLGEFGDITVIGASPGEGSVDSDDALPYRAPEQIGDGGKPTTACDVYALGAVLYECLTGRPPYEGRTREEIVARIREGLAWPPSSVARKVPAPLEAVCLKAMDPDPGRRYGSAEELARDVERWVAGERVLADGAPRGPLLRWLRNHKALAALAFFLVVEAAAGLTIGAFMAREQRRQVDLVIEANVSLQAQIQAALASVKGAQAEKRRMEAAVGHGRQQRAFGGEARQHALHALQQLVALAAARPDDGSDARQRAAATALTAARQMARSTDAARGTDRVAVLDNLALGDLFLLLRQGEEARRRYEIGLALARALASVPVDPAHAQLDVFAAARGLGQAHLFLGQAGPARDAFRLALVAAEALAAANANNLVARRRVAHGLELLGTAGVRLGDLAGARKTYEAMLALVDDYARTAGDQLAPREDRLRALSSLGDLEGRDHWPEAALGYYDRALKEIKDLEATGKVQDPAALVQSRQELERRASLMRSGARAVEDLEYALAQPPEEAARLLLTRLVSLGRRGRHADAAATAEKLRALRPDDAGALYNAGCGLALCAAAVAPGKPEADLTAEERSARAAYAGRALDALRDAVARGWKDADHAQADPDWAAVRADPRFAALVRAMRLRQALLTFPVLP